MLELAKLQKEFRPEVVEDLKTKVEKAKEKLPTEILLTRLKNPRIQEQILKTFEKYRTSFANQPVEALRLVNERIAKELSNTGIVQKSLWNFFFGGSFNRFTNETAVVVGGDAEDKEANMIFKAIAEAHEKEHSVRSAVIPLFAGIERKLNSEVKRVLSKNSLLSGKVWGGVLLNGILLPMKLIGIIEPTMMALLLCMKVFNTPYLHRTFEVYARMSQLKNYFGFEGEEKFTPEHLKYAKENYLKDNRMESGKDAGMRNFLKAITSESEEKFLEVINSHGI